MENRNFTQEEFNDLITELYVSTIQNKAAIKVILSVFEVYVKKNTPDQADKIEAVIKKMLKKTIDEDFNNSKLVQYFASDAVNNFLKDLNISTDE